MSFFETPRFPERIAYGASGGASFTTMVVRTESGAEQRTAMWSYPLHQWDVSQGVKSATDFAAVRGFFLAAKGRLHGWRFKDWSDYTASHTGDEKGIVTALTATTFQAWKRYTSGSNTQDRKIVKPVTSTMEIKVSGIVTAFTVDTTTGIVTIATAPAAANVTWSGEFDVPMRFDTDKLDARLIGRTGSKGLLAEWSAIPITELRL
jgi:uncharacterized protein (TIGR02217 family)